MLIFVYTIIAIITIFSLWFVERFLNRKWLKYIVVAILLLIALVSFNNAYNIPSPDFKDLSEFVIGIYCLIVSTLALIASLTIDIIRLKK